jgi:uncharacterized protein with FMN-binding domain
LRRITLWFLSTVAAVVLMFTYRTSTSGPSGSGTQIAANAPGVVSTGDPGATGDPAAAGSPATASPAAGSPATGSPAAGGTQSTKDAVVNGTVSRTRWGPVQVRVRIAAGRISDVSVLQQPNGNRTDQEINSYALPQLRQQTLQSQSGNIDGVSGATVTSDGYRQSLQSALDAVHFGS